MLSAEVSIKNREATFPGAASILPPPSSRPLHTCSAELSRERKHSVLKWGTGTLPRKPNPPQTAFKKTRAVTLIMARAALSRSLSHTFIRNLVINHSLEARRCHSRRPQALSSLLPSPAPYPAEFSRSHRLISMQPGASRVPIPSRFELRLGIRLLSPAWISQGVRATQKGEYS